MQHSVLAIIIQAMFWPWAGPWTGCAAAILVFFMREVTQAEYRWIEANGGFRAAMPWWKGLDVRLWTMHSYTDVVWPALATAVLAGLFKGIS